MKGFWWRKITHLYRISSLLMTPFSLLRKEESFVNLIRILHNSVMCISYSFPKMNGWASSMCCEVGSFHFSYWGLTFGDNTRSIFLGFSGGE